MFQLNLGFGIECVNIGASVYCDEKEYYIFNKIYLRVLPLAQKYISLGSGE